jgi:hypothetical protein
VERQELQKARATVEQFTPMSVAELAEAKEQKQGSGEGGRKGTEGRSKGRG